MAKSIVTPRYFCIQTVNKKNRFPANVNDSHANLSYQSYSRGNETQVALQLWLSHLLASVVV